MSTTLVSMDSVRYWHSSEWCLEIDNVEISTGEFVGIVGPNGSGKSTFLRLLAGVLNSNQGGIYYKNRSIFSFERCSLARQIGYLPQENFSHSNYTVKEVIALGRYPHNHGYSQLSAKDNNIIEHCLKMTDLVELATHKLSELSGGEKKRAFLASVLALEPELLLLDEPGSSLDLNHQTDFFKLLKKLSKDGVTIIVVTHELNLASLFCTKLIMLNDGRISNKGKPTEVITSSAVQSIYGHSINTFMHPAYNTPAVLPLSDDLDAI